VDRFVTTVDVQQTLLGLLGLEPCGAEQAAGRVRPSCAVLPHRGETRRSSTVPWVTGPGSSRLGTSSRNVQGARDHILFDRLEDADQVENLFGRPRTEASSGS